MMPTTDEGAALVPDEPTPEVEAELEAAADERVAAPSGERRSRPTRRQQRRSRALARDVARAAREAAEDPRRSRAHDETLGEYLARVEASRLPRRRRRSRRRTPAGWPRGVRVATVAAVIVACVALPWAAPQVPHFLAGLVPGGASHVDKIGDPPVAPSTDAFVGPVGVSSQAGPYDGVRLEAAGPPREVVVARLRVDSRVVPISGQSGTLLPPSDPQVLGWWQEGKPVGAQYGTAVVTGHTVHAGGGALDNLDKLVVGDAVRVRTDQGWITYVVQRNRIYSKDKLAREASTLFRPGGNGRLLLITCDDWNGSFYESNAVVVAVPVDDQPFVSNSDTGIPDDGPVPGGGGASGNMDRLGGVVTAKMFDR
jgi:LPXTG-site transpeptidase (sortase) family protein